MLHTVTFESFIENRTYSMSQIEIIPLGGGRDVGRSCILTRFKDGTTIMFDCGVHMGKFSFFFQIFFVETNARKKRKNVDLK